MVTIKVLGPGCQNCKTVEAVARKAVTNFGLEAEFEKVFASLIKGLNMKILKGPIMAYCDMPGNRGFTGTCIIETSHNACHVWDETDPALVQLDVYTCGELNKEVIVTMLKFLEPVKIEYMVLDREHSIEILEQKTC